MPVFFVRRLMEYENFHLFFCRICVLSKPNTLIDHYRKLSITPLLAQPYIGSMRRTTGAIPYRLVYLKLNAAYTGRYLLTIFPFLYVVELSNFKIFLSLKMESPFPIATGLLKKIYSSIRFWLISELTKLAPP